MHFGNGRLCLIFNNISCLLVKVIFLTFWGCVFSKPDAVICWGTIDLQFYSAFNDNQLLWCMYLGVHIIHVLVDTWSQITLYNST